LSSGGDISFYEDTGTTVKFFWDASAESLGIGTSSPATALEVKGDGASVQVSSADYDVALLGRRGSSGTDLDKGYMRLRDTGTTKVAIDSGGHTYFNGGNVGIGTDSPDAALEVNSGGGIHLSDHTAGRTLIIKPSLDGAVHQFTSDNTTAGYAFSNDSSELLRISSSGNVGIGAAPSSYAGYTSLTTSGTTGTTFEQKVGSTLTGSLTTDSQVTLNAVTAVPLVFKTTNIERMRIDASGDVGIGTSSPTAKGHFYSTTTMGQLSVDGTGAIETGINFKNGGTTYGQIYFNNASPYDMSMMHQDVTGSLIFGTNDTERMRIDASGTVLVGTTSTSLYNDTSGGGINLSANGGVTLAKQSSSASDPVLLLNNTGTDGQIVDFRKDGTAVGSIGTIASRLFIGNDDVFLTFQGASDRIYPASSSGGGRDNAIDLGDAGARFKDIYATNGTIQTSDAREKTAVRELTDAEMRVAKKLSKNIGFFQWLSAVEEKGEDARSHCGQTVQGVIAEFEAEGLDAFDYAMVCYNSWEAEGSTEAGDRFSLRTDQLNHFMIRGLAQSQEELEARLSALEV
jgi:hypothetical protein